MGALLSQRRASLSWHSHSWLCSQVFCRCDEHPHPEAGAFASCRPKDLTRTLAPGFLCVRCASAVNYSRRKTASINPCGSSVGKKTSAGLSIPNGDKSTKLKCLLGKERCISRTRSKLFKTCSPIAYKVCCNDWLSCSANVSSKICRTPCHNGPNSISLPS